MATTKLNPTFVLTWNPELWSDQVSEQLAVNTTAFGGVVPDRWATGNRRSGIEPGDRVILLAQGRQRGMVRRGVATSTIFEGGHWRDPDEIANYVKVDWTEAVDILDRLPIEDLRVVAPSTNWNAFFSSGNRLRDEDAPAVHAAWDAWYGDMTTAVAAVGGDEAGVIPARGSEIMEGALTTASVNRYERSRVARQQCIDHYGATCAACGIDFAAVYGDFAEGFIHVHHTKPLAGIKASYAVDPITDLVPVCPNCHAMIHHRTDGNPRSIEEIRRLFADS